MAMSQEPVPVEQYPPRPGRVTATERIKAYILERRLRPGDPLPTEAELCAALGVSRSSVREAVRTLAALDIVEVRHGYGTYVGRLSLSALVEGLAFRGLLSPDDDVAVFSDLVEVREALEVAMAARIVATIETASPTDLDDLVQAMEQKAAGGETFLEEDRAFHARLMEPLGNALILQLVTAFWDVYSAVAPYMQLSTVSASVESAAAHRHILSAARSGDVDALRVSFVRHYAPVRSRIEAARARTAAAP